MMSTEFSMASAAQLIAMGIVHEITVPVVQFPMSKLVFEMLAF